MSRNLFASASASATVAIALAMIGFGADAAQASAATPAPSSFAGVWKPTRYITELRTVEGKEPPLLLATKQIYDKNRSAFVKGDTSFYGVHPCLNLGQPRMNFIPYPFEIVMGKNTIAMVYQWNGYRRVDMTGKAPKADYPVLNGASAGRFDRGDLVVTTTGLLGTTFLDAAGLPHSEELTITERLSLAHGGAMIEDRMTFDDPRTFSRPWTTVVTWKRLPPGTELSQSACVDRIAAGKPALDPNN